FVRPATEGALLAAASAVAYGSLGVLTKLAYAEGWNVPSLLAARFGVAALVVLPFALARRGPWRGFGAGFLVGALGYASTTALYFPSIRLLPAALASFLLYLAPPIVAVLALGGLALMASGAATGEASGLGVLLAVGSAVAYALTTLASRRVAGALHWTRASLAVALGAFASYLAFSLATRQLAIPRSPAGLLDALGIGTLAGGVALSLFMMALPRIGASRTSVISTLEPVSTLALGAFVLGEVPGWLGLLGGLLIVVAAALVAATGHETRPATGE